ncbi:MAG: phytanoyl-CoA dioxygenase family protein [Candidatus Latescibacteria bacterium]|nr:phytanoyl-CoA dioxygenase family protein [Candidatus Latescibacterota bacterium]
MTTLTQREKYQLTREQRHFYGQNGYLRVEGLLTPEERLELDQHSMNLALDKVDLGKVEGLNPRNEGTTPADMEDKYFRFIQFHRHLEIHERYILHPRILDVLEALVGPDVMAMQSMLFLKPPGKPGQAFHQDSYYIKTYPDTLCGAWIAIDDATDENGCMGFVPGSQYDAISQEIALPENTTDFQSGLTEVQGVDTSGEILAEAKAGDVVFFHGHLLHRSRQNRSRDRFRRCYVCHYANARAYTEWAGGNVNHLLARGATHLPFAKAKFSNFEPEPAGGI